MTSLRFIAYLFLTLLSFHSHAELYLAHGSPQELADAIRQANESGGSDLIRAIGIFEFPSDFEMPPVTSKITIEGVAVFRDIDHSNGGVNQIFLVEPLGDLTIEEIQFTGFDLGRPSPSDPLLENFGRLRLEFCNFSNITGVKTPNPRFGGPKGRGLLVNHGYLEIAGSTFDNTEFSNTLGGLLENVGEAHFNHVLVNQYRRFSPLTNTGSVYLRNVTWTGDVSETIHVRPLFNLNSPSSIKIVNSIFENVSNSWCDEVDSLGYNIVTNKTCNFSAPGDLSNEPTGLLPLRSEQKPGTNLNVTVPVRQLSATSIAIDSANQGECMGQDILGRYRDDDGNNDGIAVCDRGAVEFQPASITTGGITGLYYDVNADGHYVQILETPYNTMVTWNTVDRDGNQAWVYGIGDLVGGQSLVAEAYINYGGVLTDTGPVQIDSAEEWGTIQVEMDSCYQGRVVFSSILPQFGSGSFDITRLAFSKQIGCQD